MSVEAAEVRLVVVPRRWRDRCPRGTVQIGPAAGLCVAESCSRIV